MDLSTVIGLVLGFVALFVGMAMKGVTPDSLFNVAAILIIVCRNNCIGRHRISDEVRLKRVPKLFGIIFKEQKLTSDSDIITMFSNWADIATT